MDFVNLIISLVSGIVGGNVAGAAMPDKSLGGLGNSIAGFFGGGIGGAILNALGLFTASHMGMGATGSEPSMDLGQILANIGSSGVGGALLMTIIGFIKNAVQKT